MERLVQDLRYGVRMLVRFPGVTAAALLALALGTGVNTALFSIVNAVLLRPLPFPDADELVQVWRTELPRLQFGSASYPRYVDWRAQNRVFDEMGAYSPGTMTLTGREAPEQVATGRATASFFATLAAPPLAGRYFTDDEDRPGGARVAVVGEQLWRGRFGGAPDLLGSTLILSGEPHTVIGIAPAVYRDMWRRDLWVPLAMEVDPAARGSNFLLAVGRLRNGLSLEQAQAGLADLAASLQRQHSVDRYGFFTLTLHDVLTRGPRQALWILLGATGVVLLIGCVNVSNLLLARSVSRQREMAVRTALGAGRGRLLRQMTTETVLLALLGGALGLALAAGLLRVFALVAPANFPRLGDIGLDPRVLGFSLVVASVAGLLAGVLPALYVSRAHPAEALRAGGGRGATGGKARAASRLLVAAEIAMAVMLVAAAGLTLRSLQALLDQDLGFAPQGVLTFNVALPDPPAGTTDDERARQFVSAFEARLASLPGATRVGAINLLPIASTGMNAPVRVPERTIEPEDSPLAEFRTVTPGYFEAIGLRMVAGRSIDGGDHENAVPVVVINEALARQLWPELSPADVVGRQIGLGFETVPWRQVVGIAADVRSRRPDAAPDAETYVPHAQAPLPSMVYTVRAAGNPEALVPAVRAELAALDPQLPLAAVRTFDEVIASATRTSRLYSVLTAVFGLLAAALAIVGIYSVMAWSVAGRARELAVRAALGSTRQGLLALVLREGFLMSGVGIAAGLAGAFLASRVLRALLYQVSPTDPLVFGLTAAGVALAAVLGYLAPAIRASRVEPVVALRAE